MNFRKIIILISSIFFLLSCSQYNATKSMDELEIPDLLSEQVKSEIALAFSGEKSDTIIVYSGSDWAHEIMLRSDGVAKCKLYASLENSEWISAKVDPRYIKLVLNKINRIDFFNRYQGVDTTNFTDVPSRWISPTSGCLTIKINNTIMTYLFYNDVYNLKEKNEIVIISTALKLVSTDIRKKRRVKIF